MQSQKTWVLLLTALISAAAVVLAAIIGVDAKHDREALTASLDQRDAEIRQLRDQVARHEASPGDAQDEPNSTMHSTPPSREAQAPPLGGEVSKVASKGDVVVESRPAITKESDKPFETESYRLTVGEVKKSGNTVRVTMALEVIGESGVIFHAGKWYLLDENGERWNELNSDSPSARLESERALAAGMRAPFRDRIRLVPGTRVKDSIVFGATGSGEGVNFTLIGVEDEPQPRRDIILRGLVASGG